MKADRRRHFDGVYDRIEEANRKGNHTQVFRSLDKPANIGKSAPHMGAVRDANGAIVCDEHKALECWREYCEALYSSNDPDSEERLLPGQLEPHQLRDEVRAALART